MSPLYSLLLSKSSWRTTRTRFFIFLILVLIASITFSTYLTLLLFSPHQQINRDRHTVYRFKIQREVHEDVFQKNGDSKSTCRFHTCFEINNCSITGGDRIGVYVYPDMEFSFEDTDEKISSFRSVEYRELIEAVKNSRYYQQNFSKACVFIPSFDTLSQDLVDVEIVSLMLHSLPQ